MRGAVPRGGGTCRTLWPTCWTPTRSSWPTSSAASFTYQQQEMLCRYVTDLGGGLVMIGGPNVLRRRRLDRLAGGRDPAGRPGPAAEEADAQGGPGPDHARLRDARRQLLGQAGGHGGRQHPQPAGPGRRAGVRLAARPRRTGCIPLSEVGDKTAIIAAIEQMQMGDMPDFGPPHAGGLRRAGQVQRRGRSTSSSSATATRSLPEPATAERTYKTAGITCHRRGCVFPHCGRRAGGA